MKTNWKTELPFLLIMILPFMYLMYLWQGLPVEVPIHWDSSGAIDQYGSKLHLLLLAALSVIVYLVFLIVPKVDPKYKLQVMGGKYQQLKFIMVAFFAVISLYLLYATKHETLFSPNVMYLIIGAFIMMLGNYFKTIRSNYFIGIRTPWTLESETVWKKTHKLGGKLWFYGGAVLMLASVILGVETINMVFWTGIIAISFIPAIYSFFAFKAEQI